MKLFVTDYDDTLYRSDESIKENIKRIKALQQNNFLFVIATGRSYPSIKLQVNNYHIPYDYLICSDGSIIYNHDNIYKKFVMQPEIKEEIKNFYQKLPYEEIQFSYPDGYFPCYQGKDLLGINICLSNINYNNEVKEKLLKLKDKFPNYNYLAYTHPNFSYLCVKPLKISKAYAIDYLRKSLKIKKNDVYVIGDSSNDLEMICEFNGVGMKNSCQEILENVSKTYIDVSNYIDEILKEG